MSKTIKRYGYVLAVAAALLLPQVVSNTYYVTMFCLTLIYIIIAFGLNFITGMTGQMNLGTAGIFCLGAYTSALLTTKTSISPWIALIVVIGVGFLIGVGLGYPSFRLEGVYLSLTTIAFAEELQQLATNMTDFTGGAQGVRNIPPFTVFGYEITSKIQNYYFILAFVILFGFISYRIMHSKWGRAFIAIRDNIDAVSTCGINTAHIKIIAFTLASVFGCVAGGLYAHYSSYINASTFTLNLSVTFVVMILIGGMGNLWGCILGAVIVSMLPEFLRFLGEYYQLTYSILILLCILFMPGGILSVVKKLKRKR